MKKLILGSMLLTSGVFFAPAYAQQDAASSAPATSDTVVTAAPDAPAPIVPAMTASEATVPPAGPAMAPPAGDTVAALPSGNQPQNAQVNPIEKEINEQLAYLNPNVDVNRMPSLFFSIWEHDLIADARRGLTTRAPGTDDGIAESGPRDIELGGIVYASGKDWTIWLNNSRVSPNAIPDEVLDLKVFKEYIELEWFDASTNQIYPIRLRPHQRFNLDTRIFLPG